MAWWRHVIFPDLTSAASRRAPQRDSVGTDDVAATSAASAVCACLVLSAALNDGLSLLFIRAANWICAQIRANNNVHARTHARTRAERVYLSGTFQCTLSPAHTVHDCESARDACMGLNVYDRRIHTANLCACLCACGTRTRVCVCVCVVLPFRSPGGLILCSWAGASRPTGG